MPKWGAAALHPYETRLLAPTPEDFPGCHELLHYSGCGQIQEAAAIGGLAIFFFYEVGAEEA